MKLCTKILVVFMCCMFLSSAIYAQDQWYVSTTFQVIGSKFNDETAHNSYYFYGGLRYQTPKLYVSASMPVVYDSGNQFVKIGSSGLSNDHMGTNNYSGIDSSNMNSPVNLGLGDLYINGSIKLIEEKYIMPSISFDGYIKFPTASTHLGIGTGEYDFQLAIGLRKHINNFSFFGQLGYLYLGNSFVTESRNPFTVSLGIGYTFGYGKHSLLLAYDSYSTFIQGFTSPEQLGLGYNYLVTKDIFLTIITSIGLNSSTSDYTLSTGLSIEI